MSQIIPSSISPPKPTLSNPVPFDSERFSESLTSKTHPTRLSSMKPSTIPIRSKTNLKTESNASEPIPFDSGRFGGRLGGGDFDDRIDTLEGNEKEGKNTNFRKISDKSRPLTGVDSRLSKIPPSDDSEPIEFDNERFGTRNGRK
uniref:Uncharacterized protein n=1 Tax=Panagrolaimus sp. ES5 TaxID=591445 RepID=A0AC34G4T7_9BILA